MMVKIIETKHNQTLVTVPRSIAKAKGFTKGKEAEWVLDNLGQLILREKR